MKVCVTTLGCKVNQYESQAMLAQLTANGFQACGQREEADVILINSCTVTAQSDHKVRQALHKARREHPGSVIVLTGCMPQAFPEEAVGLSEADIVLGNRNRASLLSHILQYLSTRQRIVDIAPHQNKDVFEPMAVGTFHERTRAFLKIQDGCNRFCSYCIIPYARGRVRSKPLADLQKEIAQLGGNGYKEVVLTGINLSAYGQDLGLHLCDAVETACADPKIERVRLGSLEPEQLQLPVLERLSKQHKLCPQFHLSLQSGCDATLRRMNRHYTAGEYRTIVQDLRAIFPDSAVTTDVMVGFPGETDGEFAESLKFVEEIGFAKAHVFAYSRRPGTRAGDAPDQVPNRVKEKRSGEMIAVTKASQQAFFRSQLHTVQPVLLEQEASFGQWEGYTPNYTPVLVCADGLEAGQILEVRLTGVEKGHCLGTPAGS